MSSPVRDFLTVEKQTLDDMTEAQMRVEIAGWRALINEIPSEVLGWIARKYETVRFVKRNYQGTTGVLIGIKFEAVEYEIGVVERGYDSLKGSPRLEHKTVVLPDTAKLYFEAIEEIEGYDPAVADEELTDQTIEFQEELGNG